MKKLRTLIGGIGAIALAASVIPYRIKTDKETGAFELGSLLWSLKKTVGEENDRHTLELLPLVGGKEKHVEEDAVTEESFTEEPLAEEGADA